MYFVGYCSVIVTLVFIFIRGVHFRVMVFTLPTLRPIGYGNIATYIGPNADLGSLVDNRTRTMYKSEDEN